MENLDLETLIRNFTAGDRRAGTVLPLNAAAWACFHDPWEVQPAFLAMAEARTEAPAPDSPGQSSARPERPQGGVLAGRLADFLEARRWDYRQVRPGDFHCTLAQEGMAGPDLALRLVLDGRQNRQLRFTMTSAWVVPEGALSPFGWFNDKWNHADRDLTALLDTSAPLLANLTLHGLLPLTPRTSMRTMVAFLDECLTQAEDYWAMARHEARRWEASRGDR